MLNTEHIISSHLVTLDHAFPNNIVIYLLEQSPWYKVKLLDVGSGMKCRKRLYERTLTVGGRITVQLGFSLARLELTKKEKNVVIIM